MFQAPPRRDYVSPFEPRMQARRLRDHNETRRARLCCFAAYTSFQGSRYWRRMNCAASGALAA
jgi:hypothetical protein